MQYHLNGFRAGDPRVERSALKGGEEAKQGPLPKLVDVLIVGSGPAGLTLATQLAAFGDITTRIVEQKPGRMTVGQADGVACRSMEMFQAFGFADRVEAEAYWVNETVFWRPDADDPSQIVRADRIQDVEDGLSEFPHTILSQARIHDLFLERMAASARRLEPDYSRRFVSAVVDEGLREAADAYPVSVTLERTDDEHVGDVEEIRARYVVGCDGARSAVRSSIGLEPAGDSANKLWGVMDVLAVTDFPDIRLKAAIQSAEHGSVLVIPREGGYMVRLYTELGELAVGERARERDVSPEQLIETAQRIMAPYTLDVKEVAWWSAYEIGQRVCERFDDTRPADGSARHPRRFIAGDACHTHSPKAGQGMNVSMADAFNLGWKLGAVLRGHSSPSILATYSDERQAIAAELIEFDRDMAALFSARAAGRDTDVEQAAFQAYFTKHGRYTAGVETRYGRSSIVGADDHQALAAGFVVGTRLHSAPVVRVADAKPMHLAHAVVADGRWRVLAFADRAGATDPSPLHRVAQVLDSPASPLRRFAAPGTDVDALIDVRAVVQQPHRAVDVSQLPSILMPAKGRLGLIDYEKVYCADPSEDVFDMRGIDRDQGCLVVVRPDQHVGAIFPLDAVDQLGAFFDGCLTPVDESAISTA